MIKRHKDYVPHLLCFRIGITVTIGPKMALYSGHLVDESGLHLEEYLIDDCIEVLKQAKRYNNYLQKPKHRGKH